MIEYKGYAAAFDYDEETDSLLAKVVNIRDTITFYASSVEELKREMQTSIDDYLAYCEERGIEPAKPYSGKLLVRVDPKVHRAVMMAASTAGQSMNEWIAERLGEAVSEHGAKDDAVVETRPAAMKREAVVKKGATGKPRRKAAR